MTTQSLNRNPLAAEALSLERSRWVRGAGRFRTGFGRWSRSLCAGGVRLAALWGEWRRRAQGRQQLARLDERMLKDIGISRSDVMQERAKWFWRG
jgi:uncharacterized protein YjiS (DUF1127 family)